MGLVRIPLKEINFKVAEHITKLAPFGQGNPPPLVAIRNCRLLSRPNRMGRAGGTVGMVLGQENCRIRAVGFGMGNLADLLADNFRYGTA